MKQHGYAIILGKRYKILQMEDGEKYYKTDLNAYNKGKMERIIEKVNAGEDTIDQWLMGDDGQLDGWQSYWLLRPDPEPEKNEFGEVSP